EEEETNDDAKKETEDETEKEIDSTNRPNITKIINLVKNTIYNALFNYLDSPPDSVLLASIIDPRFKKMKGWSEEDKKRAITLLRSEYAYIKNKESLNKEEEEEIINNDEINNYLDRFWTPQAN
ncbi:33774_t:CDS:2, partial [Gigaspora margarita]